MNRHAGLRDDSFIAICINYVNLEHYRLSIKQLFAREWIVID